MTLAVDVCVCTYRRASLRDTLESIGAQRISADVVLRVIVADNDDFPSAEATVSAVAVELGLRCTYVHAPARNIAVARNACLDTSEAPLIVFIDDDEVAPKQWLAKLLQAHCTTGSDIIFGPVKAIYPPVPAWLSDADLHSISPVTLKSGLIVTGYTSNVLINRAALPRTAQTVRFDPALGRSGGEDTAYFHALSNLGAKLGYCAEAVLTEYVPAHRARLSWLLTRSFRSGQTHARLLLQTKRGRMRMGAVAAAKLIFCLNIAMLRMSSAPGWRRALVRGALHAGVVARLAGMRELTLY